MIARKKIEPRYLTWNKKWGAPFGFNYPPKPAIFSTLPVTRYLRNSPFIKNSKLFINLLGMFAFERNNTNRTFEYPWAFFATPLNSKMKVLEIGGGFSGFQFVLAKHVTRVVNIDPMGKEISKSIYKTRFNKLNASFGTNVELKLRKINQTNLKANYFDRVYCISVLEHLPKKDIKVIMKGVYKTLKVGGYFIITIDLFLNLSPFSDRRKNIYGFNASIHELIKYAPFNLVFGNTSELLGFPDFNPREILANLEDYLISQNYPILTQAFILRKV